MVLLLTVSLAALAYIYVGYPLVLQLIVWVRRPRAVRIGAVEPTVSFVISAYNEVAVIRRKIENTLALDYPRECLRVVVISDQSADGTDDVVREFADRGVSLFRQEQRLGKTAGLNRTLPLLTSDIVVFSDANAMYERDALRKLVRNFADPAVGCVTGEARYMKGGHNAADRGERAYWDYEMRVKRLETAVGSMVGGDGAIYAIRRTLWKGIPDTAINDFLNPLQIVEAGWRAVYEPEAICYEETAGGTGREWRRRVRIVSRSWRAIFQARGVLNPFRVGMFAWCVVSHKILRWFSGLFASGAVIATAVLLERMVESHQLPYLAVLAGAILLLASVSQGRTAIGVLSYFAVINAASLAGVVRGTFGRVSGVWTPPRDAGVQVAGTAIRLGPVLLLAVAAAVIVSLFIVLGPSSVNAQLGVFLGSIGVLVYVYGLYPLLLALAKPLRRDVHRAAMLPDVSLLIAANDEAAVIGAKIQNSLELDYPPAKLRVVIASDGSVDGTNEIVAGFADPRVKLLAFPERRGKISSINDAMEQIDSEIVVFSHANTFLQKDAVRQLVANFADPAVGAASGDVALTGPRALLAGSEDLYYWYERTLQRLESRLGSMVGVDGALYAIRRRLFEPPPSDTILDDMAIPLSIIRAGYRVVLEPRAIAHEAGSETAMEEFARKARVIAGAVQFLVRRDGSVPAANLQIVVSLMSHKALRWLSPWFGALAFLASLRLAVYSPVFAALAAAQGLILVLGIVGCSPVIRRWAPVALAHYFCLVQTAAIFGFLRGLSGRQAATWRRFARVPVQPVSS